MRAAFKLTKFLGTAVRKTVYLVRISYVYCYLTPFLIMSSSTPMRFQVREHLTLEEIKELLSNPLLPKEGDVYRHFKGTYYKIQKITIDEISQNPFISYTSMDPGKSFFSGGKFLDEFLSTKDGKPRFELVTNYGKTD